MGLNNRRIEEKKIDFKWLYDRLWKDEQKLLFLLEQKTLPDMEEILKENQSKDTASRDKNKSDQIDDFFGHIDVIRQISTRMGIQGITKNAENTILLPLIKEALKIGHDIRKIEGKVNIKYTDYHQELAEVFEKVTEHI